MKALFLTEALTFSVIPREYPLEFDEVLILLRNEQTDLEINPAIEFTVDEKLNITITAQPADFKTQNRYELTIYNGLDVIYLGNIIVLDAGTDIQNYEYNSQSNARFDYK